MKKLLNAVLMATALSFSLAPASFAGDNKALAGKVTPRVGSVPKATTTDFVTDVDNEDNFGSGTPDGDMDTYLCRGSSIVPIEFNINIPVDPTGRSGVLKLNVFDVDTDTIPGNPEVDNVFVNGTQVGVLNGKDGEWGINVFTLPPGLLKKGNNLVAIDVDTTSGGWCVSVDYGVISLSKKTVVAIDRGWIAPVLVAQGDYINAFAEISGPVASTDSVVLMIDGVDVATLTDPDGDNVYSGQYQVTQAVGRHKNLVIQLRNSTGKVRATWPSLVVK